jgi:hypothetical protein
MNILQIIGAIPYAGRLAMVIVLYIFVLIACIFVFGSLSEQLQLNKKISDKKLNVAIVMTSIVVYLVFVFLVLNPWAADLLNL